MFIKKEKFKEPELRWQIFYTSFLQVNPENYSLKEALNLSIPYFEYIFYNDETLSKYIIGSGPYCKEETGNIIKSNKYLDFLFEQLLKYEQINKIVNFKTIIKVIKNTKDDKKLSGYFYDELKVDMKFLDTEIFLLYENCVEKDKNRDLSAWRYKKNSKGFYDVFINALVQYYEAVNEKNIFKMSSDFINLLEKKEKEKIEYLEKDFNRFFNGTLLEDVYEWN